MAELHQMPARSTRSKRRRPQGVPADWRARYASEAAGEICSIAALLQRECPEPDGDLVRGFSVRLWQLGCAVLTTLDEAAKPDEVTTELFGCASRQAQAEQAEREAAQTSGRDGAAAP